MIIKETFFAVKCDKCGQISTDHNDMQYWNEEFFAKDIALESGWQIEDDNHLCPKCADNQSDLWIDSRIFGNAQVDSSPSVLGNAKI